MPDPTPPLPEDPSAPFLTPERIWISVLVLVSAGLVAGSIVYSLDKLLTYLQEDFNVAEQAHEWQVERTATTVSQIRDSLASRMGPSILLSPDRCAINNLTLVHSSGNDYSGQTEFLFTGGFANDSCRYANDGQCDSEELCDIGSDTTDCGAGSNQRQFTCEISVTSDGSAWQWVFPGTAGLDEGCLLSIERVRNACYGRDVSFH